MCSGDLIVAQEILATANNLLVKEWGVHAQVDQQKAGWGPGNKANLSMIGMLLLHDLGLAVMKLVVYGSDTFSENVAHQESGKR